MTREQILEAAIRGAADEADAIFMCVSADSLAYRRLYALSDGLRAALRYLPPPARGIPAVIYEWCTAMGDGLCPRCDRPGAIRAIRCETCAIAKAEGE